MQLTQHITPTDVERTRSGRRMSQAGSPNAVIGMTFQPRGRGGVTEATIGFIVTDVRDGAVSLTSGEGHDSTISDVALDDAVSLGYLVAVMGTL